MKHDINLDEPFRQPSPFTVTTRFYRGDKSTREWNKECKKVKRFIDEWNDMARASAVSMLVDMGGMSLGNPTKRGAK